MKIDVYDTYAASKSGKTIHFDVLLPNGDGKEKAVTFAREFLEKIGESADSLKQERCNFCHSENADSQLQEYINKHGHYILQMENCPNPFNS
ncbi:MAG: DUF2024 family protein [Rickettsiales bacterium]